MLKFPQNQRFTLDALFNVAGWVCVVTGGGTGIGSSKFPVLDLTLKLEQDS